MNAVISDTSPFNYLVQIDVADLLPKIFGTIIIPEEVFHELNHIRAPLVVAKWIRKGPRWLQVRSVSNLPPLVSLGAVGAGEGAAIRLTQSEIKALLLIDDAEGRKLANWLGVANIGTLGVLRLAAVEGFIELRPILQRLAELTSELEVH